MNPENPIKKRKIGMNTCVKTYDTNSDNDSDNDSLLEFDMNKSNKVGSSAYQTSPSYEQVVPKQYKNQFIL